jgi:hypothetical protein
LGVGSGNTQRAIRSKPAHLGAASVVLGLLLGPILLAGCSGPAGSAGEATHSRPLATRQQRTLLTPSVPTVDLGIVPQGGHETETFSLTNAGSTPVEVARVETSCDCLAIRLARRVIGPSEKVLAQAALDLSKEPDFRGSLAIEVTGLTSSGTVAFSLVVNVTVRPREEFESKEDPS